MMNQPIKGTNERNRYSVVLDVSLNSEVIAFGILLNGQGKFGSMNILLKWWMNVF